MAGENDVCQDVAAVVSLAAEVVEQEQRRLHRGLDLRRLALAERVPSSRPGKGVGRRESVLTPEPRILPHACAEHRDRQRRLASAGVPDEHQIPVRRRLEGLRDPLGGELHARLEGGRVSARGPFEPLRDGGDHAAERALETHGGDAVRAVVAIVAVERFTAPADVTAAKTAGASGARGLVGFALLGDAPNVRDDVGEVHKPGGAWEVRIAGGAVGAGARDLVASVVDDAGATANKTT